jgi:ribose 5-phosphate isomerase B
MKRIVLGCDHAGFELKEFLKRELESAGCICIDSGAYSSESVDYPDFAHKVAESVLSETIPGILICGSGNGVCITANKHEGIRAALAWNEEIAKLARLHNDANVLCLPARFVPASQALEMVLTFIGTDFEGGRHANRVAKISCNG